MPSRLAKSLAKSLAIVAGLLAAALAHPLPAQTTPNLGLATPPTYSNPNTWGVILNNNFTIIDTWSQTLVANNLSSIQTLSGPLALPSLNATSGFQYQGAAPLNHCLVGNGTYYIDSASCGSGGGSGTVTSFSAAALSPLFTTSVATATTTPALTFALSTASQNFVFAGPATGGTGAPTYRLLTLADIPTGYPYANLASAPSIVNTINGTPGAYTFSFSSGAGSCSGTTCTFTGSGSGGGSVTNFIASSGSWPTWLVPSVATSTTTPTLSVSASAIPNSALATQTANTVLGALTATTPSGLAMPSCSTGSSALTWTTSTGFGCNTITGTGTVTSFSAGNLSPLFTTSVATATSTPALTFTISNAAQNSVLAGPATGGAGAPSYQTAPTFSAANLTSFPTFNQSTTGNAATATKLSTNGTSLQVWGMNSGASAQGWQMVSGSGTVNSGITGHLAYYATSTTAVSSNSNLDDGATTANTLTYAGSGGMAAPQLKATGAGTGGVQPAPGLFSSLAACSTSTVGWYIVTDSSTQTWGATVTGTGTPATPYTTIFCDGNLYTVMGK